MSDLGYLERLLDGATLEWLPLGQVVKILRGKRLTKSELSEDEEYPVYHGGLDPLGYYGKANRPANSVMVINVGASAGTVGFSSVDFWSSDGCFTLAHADGINSKFLYHFLIGHEHHIKGQVRVAGIPTLDAFVVEKIPIPIPCPDDQQKSLAIQAEIVRILDAFTALSAELTAKLTAELTARKTQFGHYRNQLFSFDGTDVQWRALGDFRVGAFTRGGGLQKKDFTDHGVPCIHYGQIYTYYGTYAEQTKSYVTTDFASKARKAKPGDLVIATTSENDEDVCKAVAWLGAEDVVVSSDACFFAHHLNPKYVSYFFQTEQFQEQKKARITGTKVRRVNADDLAKILIPIPFPDDPAKSLAEQERIAQILDKFDTITASLSEGLLREIALRQKQYEYYRNLLLSFPKGGEA